jgi:hypothetical protein
MGDYRQLTSFSVYGVKKEKKKLTELGSQFGGIVRKQQKDPSFVSNPRTLSPLVLRNFPESRDKFKPCFAFVIDVFFFEFWLRVFSFFHAIGF